MNNLETNIQYLKGVGPKMAEKLKRLGIETVHDLVFYFPRDYLDFSHPISIKGLRINDEAIIKAEIVSIKKTQTFRRRMNVVEAVISDGESEIKAIWFNQGYLSNVLKVGDSYIFFGKINWDFKSKCKVLNVVQYETEPKILAIYPETEGLTSKYLRKIVTPLLNQESNTPGVLERLVRDYLPEEILKKENLIDLPTAILKIHQPKNLNDIKISRYRLAFDELLFIALRISLLRKEQSYLKSIPMKIDTKILKDFVNKLPFKLTNAQRKTAWEIIRDLEKSKPMNRLLEGDVGSGKTVVAAMAVLVSSRNKMQSVWLAPTEILANQHYQNVTKILKPFNVKVGLFTSANKLADLAKDDLIIGTHALIQKNIHLKKLALIIVDEQHRFGVKQRSYLREPATTYEVVANGLGVTPHFLSMTATPIPRTLALSLYGDLDLSIIDELPAGRQKITTNIVTEKKRDDAYKFIAEEIKKGRQVFVICPLIEEGERKNLFENDKKSVMQEYEKLSKKIFPKFKIGLLHGKMKSVDKEKVMTDFKMRKIDILVSTAVVEVGIDIANATVMMIESAENFGLAQLHQFRGRVGRGVHQSYCFLFPGAWSDKIIERLKAMTTCNDGFRLAEIDLKLRGPGELAGIRQSGIPPLKMASLTDTILVEKSRKLAETIIDKGIDRYPQLQEKLQDFEVERHPE